VKYRSTKLENTINDRSGRKYRNGKTQVKYHEFPVGARKNKLETTAREFIPRA
jgi:hypothetical protein